MERLHLVQQLAVRGPQVLEIVDLGLAVGIVRLLEVTRPPYSPMTTARHDNVALKRAVFKMMDDTRPETFVRQQKAIMSRPDSRPSLGAIQCPTLVLVGNEDALTPVSVAVTIADGIAGSKLEIVQDCGHLSTMERQDAVTEALRAWIDL